MDIDLGIFEFYGGISDSNYAENGNFHVVQRPDTQILIGVTKANPEASTTVDLQVCLDDVNDEINWFTILSNIDAVTNDDGNGMLISAPAGSFTGVRIAPADSGTLFALSVREFFPPEKIKCFTPASFVVN